MTLRFDEFEATRRDGTGRDGDRMLRDGMRCYGTGWDSMGREETRWIRMNEWGEALRRDRERSEMKGRIKAKKFISVLESCGVSLFLSLFTKNTVTAIFSFLIKVIVGQCWCVCRENRRISEVLILLFTVPECQSVIEPAERPT